MAKMIEMTNQEIITSSEPELRAMLKQLLWVSLGLWFVLSNIFAVLAVFFASWLEQIALGFSVGFFLAVLNLQILGYSFLPIIALGKQGLRAVLGCIISISLLGWGVFLVWIFGENCLLGFGVGLASPALIGVVMVSLGLNNKKEVTILPS